MAARRRHQVPASENGRAKQSSQTQGKSKMNKRRDKENGHVNSNVSTKIQEAGIPYFALVGVLGKLSTNAWHPRMAGSVL